ncbi:MAG: aminodeoxychorismate lyase [Peptococcaceae bacterium BICA1-7]|nr:MAG: aminodeoxychorismate lyase [Peptococcaceae bacterium BICA1-7]HBV95725.1 endolytic transglycosylase MltG [Desulfotomaculum sp.]
MKNNLDKWLLSRRTVAYFTLFVLVLVLFMGVLFWRALLSPVETGKGSGDVGVTIPGNATCSRIGDILYENGLVRGPGLVSFYARLHGLDQNLKPGRYIFNRGQSLPEIIDMLAKGAPDLIVFTMPEGYTLAQLTDLLSSKGLADRDRFKAALAGAGSFKLPFLDKIPPGVGLEGYLFPDTYHVGSRTGEEQIISIMLNRFNAELDKLNYEKKAAKLNLNLHQAVTIASMIEGEAAVDEERPIIAGVIYNRLRLGMPLQIDATVKYALGGNVKRILYKDLEIDSPYNTYRVAGLPPGPINSPGEASLTASVSPAQTNYLYYVAKPDGTHAFAATLEEHNNNRRMYIK